MADNDMGLSVFGFLDLEWTVVSPEEAERLRAKILDLAYERATRWRSDLPADMPEELVFIARRLDRLEEMLTSILDRLHYRVHPPERSHRVRLSSSGLWLHDVPPADVPPAGAFLRLALKLPPAESDPLFILARATAQEEGLLKTEFVCIAQDQSDLLMRYLLHRQRLDQTHRKE